MEPSRDPYRECGIWLRVCPARSRQNFLVDRTLRNHISGLEKRLKRLNLEIMEKDLSRAERNRIESEIRAVNLVLQYFRTAFELEQQLQEP
jgi:hypothetical protein